jgi:hypothetical protein
MISYQLPQSKSGYPARRNISPTKPPARARRKNRTFIQFDKRGEENLSLTLSASDEGRRKLLNSILYLRRVSVQVQPEPAGDREAPSPPLTRAARETVPLKILGRPQLSRKNFLRASEKYLTAHG